MIEWLVFNANKLLWYSDKTGESEVHWTGYKMITDIIIYKELCI